MYSYFRCIFLKNYLNKQRKGCYIMRKMNETLKKETRKSPKECYLSKDFLILYRLSKKISKTKSYYIISFRSFLDRKQNKRNQKTYGKVLIQKEIPVKDLNEIENLIIEKIWNDSDFRAVVKDEVLYAMENGRIETVSLLLFSYIFYNDISINTDFNENTFLSIVKDYEFSNIMLDDAAQFYLNFATSVFLLNNKNISEKTLQVHLNYILQLAYENGLTKEKLEINLVKENGLLAEDRKARFNRKKALAAKSLSIKSETELIEWLKKEYTDGKDIYLGVLIKLFTGMTNPEICALQWSDYEGIKYTNGKRHHLLISKKINDVTKEIDFFDEKSKHKYRLVPLPMFLDSILYDRYNRIIEYMIEKYRKIIRYELTTKKPYNLVNTILDALKIKDISYKNFKEIPNDVFYNYYENQIQEEIKNFHIVSQSNKNIKSSEKFKKPFSISTLRHCAQKALNEGFKKIENKSKMPNSHETIDYSKQGNMLFHTNYQFHAISNCGLTNGELNYIIGNREMDTFSKNYCDFSSDFMQIRLAEKLDRWANAHFKGKKPKVVIVSETIKDISYQLKPIEGGNTELAIANISIKANDRLNATICIENDHGFEGNIILYKMD